MIFSSRKLFYVVEAMVAIAYNTGQGAISGKDIAEIQGLPPRYLEQLMQRLVRAGLLRGMRGPNGGYVLARERRRITLADIYDALEEEKEEDARGYKATPLGAAVVQPVWSGIDESIMQRLKSINLADLCEKAVEKNIRKNVEDKSDFNI